MRSWPLAVSTLLLCLLISFDAKSAGILLPQSGSETDARIFAAKGVVEEINPDAQTVTIKHEAVSNYMAAMTMPFKVKDQKELAGLQIGDEISFQHHVTETESWVDQFTKIGTV